MLTDAYKAENGYKNIRVLPAHFKPLSTIKKLYVRGAVEMRARSRWKLSENNQKITLIWHYEPTGVSVHHSALQSCLQKHDLHGSVIRRKHYLQLHDKSLVTRQMLLIKWCFGLIVKLNYLVAITKYIIGVKKEQDFMEVPWQLDGSIVL